MTGAAMYGRSDVCIERKHGQRRFWGASPGQAMAEMALVFPVFMLIIAATFTGSQYLTAVAGLDGAARAGVLAYVAEMDEGTTDNDSDGDGGVKPPTAQWQSDAVKAVNNEQGSCTGTGCFSWVANQAACGAGQNCVWVVEVTGARNNHTIEVLHVQRAISSYVGIFGDHSVSAQAALEP
jgi:Flp pilus assembly protein TadG